MNASFVAGLDQQFDVSIHERHGHRDGRSVRKDEVGILTELFNNAEDVIPSTAVESGTMITELEDDL